MCILKRFLPFLIVLIILEMSDNSPPNDFICFNSHCHDPVNFTNYPMVTGSSVVGLTCCDCVLIAADTLGSYGSLSRFKSISRIKSVGKYTIVSASGDLADFQYISDRLDEKVRQCQLIDDSINMDPKEIFSWLNRILYYRRSQLNPLWLSIIVAGWSFDNNSNGKPFLSYIDMVGTSYEDTIVTTGMGNFLIKPLLRKAIERTDTITIDEKEGHKILSECMKVLFYRDGRAYPRYISAKISNDGVRFSEPVEEIGSWSIAEYVCGYD